MFDQKNKTKQVKWIILNCIVWVEEKRRKYNEHQENKGYHSITDTTDIFVHIVIQHCDTYRL